MADFYGTACQTNKEHLLESGFVHGISRIHHSDTLYSTDSLIRLDGFPGGYEIRSFAEVLLLTN